MDSTYILGTLLVALSAFFLATHWQQWRELKQSLSENPRLRDYQVRTMRRRAVASSLVGIVGFTLMAFETVPRKPLSITAYLLALVLMTCWILCLACLDMWASRQFHQDQQLEQIAAKLRQDEIEHTGADSEKNGSH